MDKDRKQAYAKVTRVTSLESPHAILLGVRQTNYRKTRKPPLLQRAN